MAKADQNKFVATYGSSWRNGEVYKTRVQLRLPMQLPKCDKAECSFLLALEHL